MPFDEVRIKEAVERAAHAAGVNDADYCATVACAVAQQMQDKSRVDIREIQDAVENLLMSGNYKNWRVPTSNTATTETSHVNATVG